MLLTQPVLNFHPSSRHCSFCGLPYPPSVSHQKPHGHPCHLRMYSILYVQSLSKSWQISSYKTLQLVHSFPSPLPSPLGQATISSPGEAETLPEGIACTLSLLSSPFPQNRQNYRYESDFIVTVTNFRYEPGFIIPLLKILALFPFRINFKILSKHYKASVDLASLAHPHQHHHPYYSALHSLHAAANLAFPLFLKHDKLFSSSVYVAPPPASPGPLILEVWVSISLSQGGHSSLTPSPPEQALCYLFL